MERSFLLNFQTPCQISELTGECLLQASTESASEGGGRQQTAQITSNTTYATMTKTFVRKEGGESENNIFQMANVIPQCQTPMQTKPEGTGTANVYSSAGCGTRTKTATDNKPETGGDEDAHLFSLRAIPLCY